MRRIIIFASFIIWNTLLHAQSSQTGQFFNSDYHENLLPKNAQPSSLGSFGNLPINYYSGLPEIALPILTLTSRDLSLPISINYDASGVKTDELSGQVGLKWMLNAGGYIVRDLNGLPDEHPTLGYWKSALDTDYWNNNFNVADWVTHSEKNSRDTSPDEFIINLNGRSVRFVFDKYKRPVPIPRQNIKIAYTMVSNKIQKFEVTTEDGIKYIFGGDVSSIEERKIENLTIKTVFRWEPTYEKYIYDVLRSYYTGGEIFSRNNTTTTEEKTIDLFNSKWYLKQIVSPTGDIISFNYTKGADIKYATKPIAIRSMPLTVTLDTYTSNIWHCTSWIAYDWWCGSGKRFYFTHPGTGDAGLNIFIEPGNKNLLAIRKFIKTDPGTVPYPIPNFNTVNNRVPQARTDHYFKPEDHPPYPGAVTMNHALITESNIRLLSIVAGVGSNSNKITFTTSAREDLPNAVKYDRISLYDLNNIHVKTIKLNYASVNANESNDFFWISEALMMTKITSLIQSPNLYFANFAKDYHESSVNHNHFRKYVFEGLKSYNYKRTFLESIVDETGGLNIQLYGFEYQNRHLLKRRTTPLADKFGFTRIDDNGYELEDFEINNQKKARIINSYIPNRFNGSQNTVGILNKIVYPTKGYTELSFVANIGPQIRFIRDRDEAGGVISQKEVKYLNTKPNGNYVTEMYLEQRLTDETTNEWMKLQVISSAAQNDSPLKGPLIANSHVRVFNGTEGSNNGYEEFKYTSKVSAVYDDEFTLIKATPIDGVTANYDKFYFPYPRKFEREYLRGLLLEHLVYKANPSVVIRKVENTYKINPYNYNPAAIQGFTGGSFNWTKSDKRYRRGNFKIVPEWIILEKTTETIYDIDNPSTGSFTTVSEYKYDPLNLQMIETARYNQLEPNVKTISKTKYVTHADYSFTATNEANCQDQYTQCMAQCETEPDWQVRGYCQSDCNNQYSNCVDNPGANAAPETDAIITLKNKHQINTPVEVQGLIQDNGAEKLISAVVYNYTKEGSPTVFVKPKTILGMKQAIDPAGFQSSKVDQSGILQIDNRLRTLHSFNSYQQNTGNLLQQTSLDGISTAYTWGHNNSLVTGFTVNPGSSISQTFSYNHKLLVGLNYVTDQNNLRYYYDYDRLNRLKLEKDNDGNITARYRYHYKTSRGYNMTISGPANGVTGQSVNYSSYEDLEYGQTTYEWNMGDGNIKTSSFVNHIYQLPGNYTVTLKKTNPEYGTVTVTKGVLIGNPAILSILVEGSSSIDLCSVWNGSTSLMATIRNGCPPYSFSWEYRFNGGSWIVYAAGSPVQPPPGFGYQEGYWEVRCTAYSSACNDQVTSASIWLSTYKSDPGCFGPIMH